MKKDIHIKKPKKMDDKDAIKPDGEDNFEGETIEELSLEDVFKKIDSMGGMDGNLDKKEVMSAIKLQGELSKNPKIMLAAYNIAASFLATFTNAEQNGHQINIQTFASMIIAGLIKMEKENVLKINRKLK